MNLLSPAQIRNWDKFTIEHEPISSINLMERAATACYLWLMKRYGRQKEYLIFCGTGNNGGDGLAIARMLQHAGVEINVAVIGDPNTGSPDCKINFQRLKETGITIALLQTISPLPTIKSNTIIIDAIFGTGLNRAAEGTGAEIIKNINRSGAEIISVDIPSGMFADNSSKNNIIVNAHHTLTFQSYKLAFLMAENADPAGHVHVLDIGLHAQFLQTVPSDLELIENKNIKALYRPRKSQSHKGNFGHAMLIAGSKGKMGAAILAASACLRSGAGLLTVSVPAEENHIMQLALPEAMTSSDAFTEGSFQKFNCLGIGPGWGTAEAAAEQLHFILQHYTKPVVLDADALNLLSVNKDWLQLLPAGSILTPHPKEFERLFGTASSDFERLELARQHAAGYNVIIILKGHRTAIVLPEKKVYFNPTGNPGMAKGGSGDVLTGILTGLLAQGYTSKEAALMGVYLHGMAGDIAAATFSQEAMIAGDIVQSIGKAFTALISSES